jgi:hypothetical protein
VRGGKTRSWYHGGEKGEKKEKGKEKGKSSLKSYEGKKKKVRYMIIHLLFLSSFCCRMGPVTACVKSG